MSLIDVLVPEEQEGTKAVVRGWLAKLGQRVEENDPLVELETDKVTQEVPAPVAGVLTEILLDSDAEAEQKREAQHARAVIRVPPAFFMQNGGDVLRLPIVKNIFHVTGRSVRAFYESGFITDVALLSGNRCDVLSHHFRGNLHVTDLVVTEGFRIAIPNIHAMRH